MWPTFFIPQLLAGGGGFVDPQVGHECGTWSFLSTVTIPTPTGASAGDTQLVIVTYQAATAGTLVFPTFDGNPWWLVNDNTTKLANYGTGYQTILWRVYDPADGDLELTAPGAAGKGVYASIILKNQHATDPFFSAYTMAHTTDALINDVWWANPLTGLEAAQSGDLAVFASPPDSGAYADTTGPGAEAEFFCNNSMTNGSSPHIHHVVSGTAVYTHQQNNLLGGCPSLSSTYWTSSNASVTTSSGTYHKNPAVLEDDGTSNKHYVEQEIQLEAGKTYIYAVVGTNFYYTYPQQDARWYMTVLDPSGNEAGLKYDGSFVTANDTTILPIGDVASGVFLHESLTSSREVYGCAFFIRPSTTQNYRFRIYVSRDDTDPTGSPGTSNPIGAVVISGVSVQELPADYMGFPTFLETTAPINPGDVRGILPTSPRRATGDMSGYTWAVLRRAGGTRPPCRLFSPAMNGIHASINDLSVTDMKIRLGGGQWLLALGSSSLYAAICATHSVSGLLSQQKFYYELSVDALGAGGALQTYSIGYCPSSVTLLIPTTSRVGTISGHFNYCADGKIYENGALATTVTAWTATDVVGASIDFSTFEIKYYLNGTLEHTSTIPAGSLRYSVWNVSCGLIGADTTDEAAEFTWNFTGPFGGRKPSGFYAFDFDNEVT